MSDTKKKPPRRANGRGLDQGRGFPGALSWKTAANCWTLLTSLCGDMVNAKKRALRTRDNNPCTNVRPPERGAYKAKQFLFPSEFLKFVSCERVPLRWRRAAGKSR